MTTEDDAILDARLRDLTQWDGSKTALWRRALSDSRVSRSWRFLGWFQGRRFSPITIGSSAAAVLFMSAIIVNFMSPHFSGSARDDMSSKITSTANLRGLGQAAYIYGPDASGVWAQVGRENWTPPQFISASTTTVSMGGPTLDDQAAAGASSTPAFTPTDSRSAFEVRHVVRSVNIDLKSDNVRAVYLKAQQLVRPEMGEYVQASSQSGSGDDSFASLTLRVAAARLSEVLDGLRELATVQSESQSGRDVTEQVVDLEARLRNELRIEQELLRLLDERKDAPLADVIQLRDKLKDVRGEIERLAGQREGLAGLTDLATILILIRTGDMLTGPQSGFSDYFGERMNAGWNSGLNFMTRTLATMLQILVGGIAVWTVLFAVVILVMRRRRV